jgi:hypothetical protein
MSSRSKSVLIWFGFLILVAGVVIAIVQPAYQVKKLNCQQILKNGVGFVSVYLYRSEYGHWPHQLNDLSNELANPLILICPGSGNVPGSFTNADSWSDYTYIDWSVYFGTNAVPDDYPLAYDRSLNNHKGRGINIVFANDIVKWDSHAESLKKFAIEHPNFRLSIPQ